MALAAPNMPCTARGLQAISTYENAFVNSIDDPETREQTRQAVQSAKRRLLHGATTSSVPGGENEQERLSLGHIAELIKKHANPAFRGFGAVPVPAAAVQLESQKLASMGNNKPDNPEQSAPSKPGSLAAAKK